MIAANQNGLARTFTFDGAGNRLTAKKDGVTTTFNYDLADQLTTSTLSGATTTYTYDGAGNQTLQVVAPNTRTTYTWNDDNRQTRVQATGVDLTAKYRYDGLRYEKAAGGTTTRFVFDGQNYLVETNSSGVVQVAYTVEPRTYGKLINRRASSASVYHHFDALGATRVLTNSSQTSTDSYLFDAWGVPIVALGATSNPFRWVGGVGYYYDTETGLYYVRARVYSSATARWMSVDPLLRMIFARLRMNTQSSFAYVVGNPGNTIDPSGYIDYQRHHWFMVYRPGKRGQSLVDALCPCPVVNIHHFTTDYTTAEHGLLHGPPDLYRETYEKVLNNSKTCCDLLEGVLALMLAWQQIMIVAHILGKIEGPESQLDLINYHTKKVPPDSYWLEYIGLLDAYCGEHRNRKTIDIKTDTFVEEIKDNFHWYESVPEFLLEGLVPAFLVGGLMGLAGAGSPGGCCRPPVRLPLPEPVPR